MAQEPRPRTFQQIVGDIEEGFLSRTGVAGLRVGGAALSAFESFAQSEARQNQDVFAGQNAADPSRLVGDQLDRYGRSRGVRRLEATAATTGVTVGDSRFTRVATRLSPLRTPPIPGQTTLYVQDASSFGVTGSVYVGRGTDTAEGPIPYTSKTDNGSDWSLALSAAIQRRHTGAEEVLLAQGGDRVVSAGTVVRTQQGSALTAASYTVQATAAIPDGEVEVREVQVACTERGTNGNAPAGAIAAFAALPFPGATVTNPLPVTNGRGVQQDPAYLEDIYRAEAARSRGTPLAIERFALGVRAEDEARTCLSASYVRQVGPEPDYLTVDDGTGYQPISEGVAREAVVSSARGGEQDFRLVGKPVTKAALRTNTMPPWPLLPGDRLAFEVGGAVTEHPLDPANYPAGADPYAVASDVNSDPLLGWEAVVTDQGRAVLFRARSEFRDDIRSVTPSAGRDAAVVLGVPRQLERTLHLFLDDVALTKDGAPASLASAPFGSWGVLAGPQTLTVGVDGTAAATYTFVDQDFVDARTGYTSVGRNSPAAWAAVLTMKVPGLTGSSLLGRTFLTSNLGASSRARVEVTGGTLVGAGVFPAAVATGRPSDFVLDRSLGEGRLAVPLSVGQELTAGSDQVRGFLPASPAASTTFASTATWWVALDAAATRVDASLTPGSTFTGTIGAGSLRKWGGRLRLTVAAGAFSSVSGGDFVVFWDPTTPGSLSGQWLVARVASDGSWIELDRTEGRWARHWAGSCVLADGRIFVAGGYSDTNKTCPASSAEVYDPATETWTHAGYMAVPRAECWAVALPDGRAVVGGGALGTPEVWEAGVFTLTSTTNAPAAALGQAAVTHSDGLVYVTGGVDGTSTVLDAVRSYDPSTDTWAVVTNMLHPRYRHAMVSYGSLLWVTCGMTTASVVVDTTEWYDPGTTLWTSGGAVADVRQGHAMSVTGMDIYVTGGSSTNMDAPTRLDTTAILVAGTPPWVAGPTMASPRAYHRQVTLSGGRILIAGGEATSSPAEVIDPTGPSIASTATPLLSPRAAPVMESVGTNGAVLGFGGVPFSGAPFGQPAASSEAWTLAGGTWAASDPVAGTSFSLTGGGTSFGRAGDRVRKYSLTAASTLTATALAGALQAQLQNGDAGSTTTTFRTTRLRWRTNTHAAATEVTGDLSAGDIYLAAANPEAQQVPFPEGELRQSGEGQRGWVLSSSELGTPDFEGPVVLGSGSSTTPAVSWQGIDVQEQRPTASHYLVGLGGAVDSYDMTRWGQGRGYASQFASATYLPTTAAVRTSVLLSLRSGPEQGFAPLDRCYFASPWALGPNDQLVVVADRDPTSLRTTLNTFRRLKPTTNTYGQTFAALDGDLAPPASLGTSFGITYDFTDHTVFMRARGKTHASSADKRVLWRWWRHGDEGEYATVAYGAPLGPNRGVEVTVDDVTGDKTDVTVRLAGGALKTGATLRSTSRLGVAAVGRTTGVSSLVIACGLAITSAVRVANVTTLTLALPTGVTNHGILVGDVVYVTSSSVNFTPGTKTVTVVTATTVKYAEVAADAGPDANIGTVSADPYGETSYATFAPALAAGDWVRVAGGSSVSADFEERTFRLTGSGAQALYARATDYTASTSTTLTWYPLLNPSFLQVFANPAQTVSVVAGAVATLYAGGSSPVEPTVTSTGTGTLDRSSADESGVSPTVFALYDGRNAVGSQVAPVIPTNNYTFTMKDSVEPSIVSDADWENEDVRLAPVTATAVARWLRSAAVSGLFPAVVAEVAGRGRRVQLSAGTFGAEGAVQVQGGSANEWAAPLTGSAELAQGGGALVVKLSQEDAGGFVSGMAVVGQLATPAPRPVVSDLTSLQTLTSSGQLTVTAGSPQLWGSSSLFSNASVVVERCGNFVKYTDAGLGTALSTPLEGDTVYIAPPATPSGAPTISSANSGAFQVVRGGAGFFWVEAASHQDQLACEADIRYVTQDSVKPGDLLTIDTDLWGASNRGTWVVAGVGDNGGGPFSDVRTVNLDVSSRAPVARSGPLPLGSSWELVRFAPAVPQRWVKRLRSITVGARARLVGGGGFGQLSNAYGTTLVALDKLGFPPETAQGRDAYRYNTGLVGAVNRVEYGDPSDPVTFPGVVSADAEVRVDGPKVRRVYFAVAVRLRQGFSPPDVEGAIRSAVASSVASRAHGRPIPVSDLIREVSRVGGVESVVPLSPYSSVEDSIQVLPGERALVLDLQRDVQVSYL